jgi:hypothetical protein
MQVSQERLNKDYLPLQLSWFEVINRKGKGKGGFRWQKKVNARGMRFLLVGLRTKLLRMLWKVEEQLYGYEKTAPSVLEMSAWSSSVEKTIPKTLTSKSDLIGAVRLLPKSSLTLSTRPSGEVELPISKSSLSWNSKD